MRRILSILFATLVISTAVFVPGKVSACSCLPFESFTESAKMSDVVMYARVTDSKGTVDAAAPDAIVTYDIEIYEFWGEGVKEGVNKVSTSSSSASCGINLEPASDYIIFATGEDGDFSTGLCSGTTSATEENLQTLREELGPGMAFFYTQGETPGDNPEIPPTDDRDRPEEPQDLPYVYDPVLHEPVLTSEAVSTTMWAAITCMGLVSFAALVTSAMALLIALKNRKK